MFAGTTTWPGGFYPSSSRRTMLTAASTNGDAPSPLHETQDGGVHNLLTTRPRPTAIENERNCSFSWAVDSSPAPPPNHNNNATTTTTCRPYHHHHASTTTTTVPTTIMCATTPSHVINNHTITPPSLVSTPKPPLQEAETPNTSIRA